MTEASDQTSLLRSSTSAPQRHLRIIEFVSATQATWIRIGGIGRAFFGRRGASWGSGPYNGRRGLDFLRSRFAEVDIGSNIGLSNWRAMSPLGSMVLRLSP
jgi:hypothetical protein